MAGLHSHASQSAASDPARHPNPGVQGDAGRQPARPLRCFLVEDSPLILQNLMATLEEMVGAEVVGHAEDEASAIAWAQQHVRDCDVMVVDIFLKAGSGLEVLRRVRPLAPTSQLVVLTNYATSDMRRRCLTLGADRVFDKSAELEEMLAYCEELAGRLPSD